MNTDERGCLRIAVIFLFSALLLPIQCLGEEAGAVEDTRQSHDTADLTVTSPEKHTQLVKLDFDAVVMWHPKVFKRTDNTEQPAKPGKIELSGSKTRVMLLREPADSDATTLPNAVNEVAAALKQAYGVEAPIRKTRRTLNGYDLPARELDVRHEVNGKILDVAIVAIYLGRSDFDASAYSLLLQKEPGSDGKELELFLDTIDQNLFLLTNAMRDDAVD